MSKLVSRHGLFLAIAVLAGALLLLASIGAAHAYFTSYVTAKGELTVSLGNQIEYYEEVKGLEKTIKINNTGAHDCFGRVKVLAPDGYSITKTSGSEWTQGDDGYWYYGPIIPAGQMTTDALVVSIGNVPQSQPLNFDVVVIEEAIPVVFDENGNPDWSLLANQGGEAA